MKVLIALLVLAVVAAVAIADDELARSYGDHGYARAAGYGRYNGHYNGLAGYNAYNSYNGYNGYNGHLNAFGYGANFRHY